MSEFRRPFHQTVSAFSVATEAYFSAADRRNQELPYADHTGDLENCDKLEENVAAAYDQMVSTPTDNIRATIQKLDIIINEFGGADLINSGVRFILTDLRRLANAQSQNLVVEKWSSQPVEPETPTCVPSIRLEAESQPE